MSIENPSELIKIFNLFFCEFSNHSEIENQLFILYYDKSALMDYRWNSYCHSSVSRSDME